MNKQLNELTGKTVMIRHNYAKNGAYPWGAEAVKAEVLSEYPNFYVVRILPHNSPIGYALSSPYTCSIAKHAILIGDILICDVLTDEDGNDRM